MGVRLALRRSLNQLRGWLDHRLQADAAHKMRLAVVCAVIFLTSLGIRLIHWQDSQTDMERADALATTLARPYLREAGRIREDGDLLFPSRPPQSGDAVMILHPPGYSFLMLALGYDGSIEQSHSTLRWLQILCDSASTVFVLLIAAEFFPLALATVAGMMIAFSPHFAHYSLWLTPETLAVLPVLAAVYLVVCAIRRPRLWMIIAAGALVGLSCWLRANNLLLALFLAATVFFTVERGRRLIYSSLVIAAMIAVILPITIRNWAIYGRFVPVSLGAGITLVEGIADYDDENRFGMPASDEDVKYKDAEWHDRPDYAGNIWTPDGIERDRARLSRGLDVIGRNPAWFAGVMIRRAWAMLRYNDSRRPATKYFSSQAPVVSKDPRFGHKLEIPDRGEPVWSNSAAELKMTGHQLAPQAALALSTGGDRLQITGDNSQFGDQFASAPLSVEKNTDYILRLAARHINGPTAAKIVSADRRITLASEIIAGERERVRSKTKYAIEVETAEAQAAADEVEASDVVQFSINVYELAFSSGNRGEVLFVISNDGPSPSRPAVEISQLQLFKLGPTPKTWTSIIRPSIRGIQRNLYTTDRMHLLIVTGIMLLAIARRRAALLILLAVPVYYLLLQSVFHTEYRYILGIHYFLFIFAAVAVYSAGKLIGQGARRAIAAFKLRRARGL